MVDVIGVALLGMASGGMLVLKIARSPIVVASAGSVLALALTIYLWLKLGIDVGVTTSLVVLGLVAAGTGAAASYRATPVVTTSGVLASVLMILTAIFLWASTSMSDAYPALGFLRRYSADLTPARIGVLVVAGAVLARSMWWYREGLNLEQRLHEDVGKFRKKWCKYIAAGDPVRMNEAMNSECREPSEADSDEARKANDRVCTIKNVETKIADAYGGCDDIPQDVVSEVETKYRGEFASHRTKTAGLKVDLEIRSRSEETYRVATFVAASIVAALCVSLAAGAVSRAPLLASHKDLVGSAKMLVLYAVVGAMLVAWGMVSLGGVGRR